jgi:plasmid stability protein
MNALLCYHAFMSRQLTVRNVPDDVGERLDRLASERGASLNTVVVEILKEAVGMEGRRARLERFATWTDEDAASFEAAIASHRVIDDEIWR